MLAKVSPVIHRIQRHVGAEPEVVHVDKLMPYQPDYGEELESWLRDEDSGGCRAKGTQPPMPVLPETPPGVIGEPSTEVPSSPYDPGPGSYPGTDSENEPSESVVPPRRGSRPRKEPDRYTEVRNVWSARETADSLIPSLLLLVALLLVVVATCMSNPGVVVMAVVAVARSVRMFSPQLLPPWTRWWAGHR